MCWLTWCCCSEDRTSKSDQCSALSNIDEVSVYHTLSHFRFVSLYSHSCSQNSGLIVGIRIKCWFHWAITESHTFSAVSCSCRMTCVSQLFGWRFGDGQSLTSLIANNSLTKRL